MEFIRRNVNGSSSTSTGGSGGGYSSVSGGNGKLETHTIFSQPFDGTNDVKGDLADVDKITADGDISTGGNLIIKGKDDDDAYNGKDLNISLDGESVKFEGGNDYTFDKVVYAPIFVGDVDAENVEADNLNATVGSFREVTTENATVMDTLTTTDLIATLAKISKIISGTIEVDNLTVKKAAHFFKLIIDEIKSVGGQLIISPANATFDKVVVSDGNYKCYFRAVEGDKKIDNQFEEKDQVVCQTFNASEGLNYDASNKFYWRLVIDKGTEELDGIDYHYIILSDSDKDADSNGVPTEGDKVALLGNRTDTSRQNAIIISAYSSAFLDSGITAPFIVQYSGVNNYNLSTHRNSIISNGKNLFTGDFVLTSGEDVTGVISELRKEDNNISLLIQEPDQVNMFEYSNGDNFRCWKAYGSTVISKKSGTDSVLVLGGTSGGYILQPSKYYIKTNQIKVQINVTELQGLASYYQMEICDASGASISNKMNLSVGTVNYLFNLTKVPNDIVNLKITLSANARLAFKNEKALMESVPKRISGIEVDIDSITSRVSGTEGQISTINQTVNQINSKVTGMEGNISQIAQKADSIESTVANIQVGGTNLINDSEFGTYSDSSNGTWTKKGATASTSFGYMNQIGIHAISNPTNSATYGYLDIAQQSLKYKLKANTNYTFSFYAKGFNGTGTDNGSSFNYKGRIATYVYPNVGSEKADNAHTFTLTDKWERYSYTFKTVDALDVGANHSCLFRLIKTVENGTTYFSNAYICMPKIEEGTMATAWDTTDADMKSYITQKADLIESKIVTEDTINSKISQSTSNIKAEVYNELNESTGIDITTGTITLNADKTVFNGNINIRNSDEGLVVFDDKGNASVIIQNKKIPSLSNLDNSTHDYIQTTEFTKTGNTTFASASQKVGTAKAGDVISVPGGSLFYCYVTSDNQIKLITLSGTSYLEYYYTLKNTTNGKTSKSSVFQHKTIQDYLEGILLSGATFNITEDGDYEVVMNITHCNPTLVYQTYRIVWGYYLDKKVSQYTQLGTNGLVSVQDQYKYMYFGDEGFEARMTYYNGFRVGKYRCQQVLAENNGVTLWGSLASMIEVAVNPKSTSMTVTAGGTSQGTKNVVRADADYFDADMFVFKSLSSEVWVKLPTALIEQNGVNYYISTGRVIKIRNLTSQKCYVYISDSGYKIYDSSGTSGVSYLSIGSGSAEFVWDGSEWVRTK